MNKRLFLVAAMSVGAALALAADTASAVWSYSNYQWAGTMYPYTVGSKTVTHTSGAPYRAQHQGVSANNTTYTRHLVQIRCWNGSYYYTRTGPTRSAITVGGSGNESNAYCTSSSHWADYSRAGIDTPF